MAEATHTPAPDPQEEIAKVLRDLDDGEPTATQLAFLNAEADKIEGGVIVRRIDDTGRTQRHVQAGINYAPQGKNIHNIDTIPHTRIDVTKVHIDSHGAAIPAQAEGVAQFNIEHTYNYIDPATRTAVRLDEPLARTLLEFSTYNRRLQSSVASPGGAPASLHKRLTSNNDLPPSGRVHIDDGSYSVLKDYVLTCPRMSVEYLETKGFNTREATVLFARLQAEGVIDTEYTPGEGYTVPPKPRANHEASEEYTRQIGRIRSALGGIVMADETSLTPVKPVSIRHPKPPVPVTASVSKETYLSAQPYWKDIITFVAQTTAPTPGEKIMLPSSAIASRLIGKFKLDKLTAERTATDFHNRLTREGVIRPITTMVEKGRVSVPEVHKYQVMQPEADILAAYSIDPAQEELERRKIDRYMKTRMTKERVKEIDDALGQLIQSFYRTLPSTAGMSMNDQLELEIFKEDGEKEIRRDYVRNMLNREFAGHIPEGLEDKILGRLESRATETGRRTEKKPRKS